MANMAITTIMLAIVTNTLAIIILLDVFALWFAFRARAKLSELIALLERANFSDR